jgi:hypothetical protein
MKKKSRKYYPEKYFPAKYRTLVKYKGSIVLIPIKRATLPAGFTPGGSVLNHGPT